MPILRFIRSIVGRSSEDRADGRDGAAPGGGSGQEALESFFLRPDNLDLYAGCPFRPDLHHMAAMGDRQRLALKQHWLGHILDMRAGNPIQDPRGRVNSAIPQDGIEQELRIVYNDLNNPLLGEARESNPSLLSSEDPRYQGFGPEQRGCHGLDAQAELMAEAFRAYFIDADYLNIVAPGVARRIREFWNHNPALNASAQFN